MANGRLLQGAGFVMAEIALVAFVGDLPAAYLSDYVIEELPKDNGVTTMVISNTGPLQPTGTAAIIAMNGTSAVLELRCPEGRALTTATRAIMISFDHMTPGMPCEIDVRSDITPPMLTQFTSKGMLEPKVVEGWGRTYGILNLVVVTMSVVQILIAVLAILLYTVLLHELYWATQTRKYKSQHADDIVKYVKRTYGIRIGPQKASIVEALADGDMSAMQIATTLSMPLPRVRTLLQRMQSGGLFDGGGLDLALKECVEKIKVDGRV